MKTAEQAAMIYSAIIECFNEESDLPYHLKIEDIDEHFFEASVSALKVLYQKVSHEEVDIIDFIGVLNKVVFQGLLEKQEEPSCH